MKKQMMTVKQIAAETGLTEHCVRQFVNDGTFPHVPVGNGSKPKKLVDIAEAWKVLERLQNRCS
jgi:predicted DNA-binding transcriptional regulator AlpA